LGTYQEEYVWSPVFITTELHHGLVWSYRPVLMRDF
jgi:hypothetical protein